MKNRSSSSSCFELQSLHHKFSLLSQNGMMQHELLEMLEGEGACRDLMNLGFADYEQLACSIPLPEKNGDNFESRDILQSLVQSCSCGDGGHEKFNIQSRGDDHIQECKLHLQRNGGTENYYYNKPRINKQEQQQQQHPYGCGGSKNKEGMKHKTTRIRWTEPLHKKFMDSVDRLGGAKKATPKGILKLMKCDGLTIFHVKSHLQKYRVCELITEEKEGNSEQLRLKTGMQIVEALRLQIDVQRRLYEQLESQKELQMRIEEQAKQLQTMLQCQLNTNNLLPG